MKIWKEITKLELKSLFDSGLWYNEIGEMYGITGRSVRDKVKKFGIVLERKNKKKELTTSTCIACKKEYTQSKNEGYCSNNCKVLKQQLNEIDSIEPTTELGEDILTLRKQGLSYSKIAKKLNCSKSTISYHLSEGCKDKIKERKKRYREEALWKTLFQDQVSSFRRRKMNTNKINMCTDWNKKFRTACSRFRTRNKTGLKKKFTYHDAINHLGGTITKCYLTGREIDITKDNFTLDHIVPVAKGGSCELENMEITIPEANAMKSDLMLDDFLNLCKEILENQGYSIIK